MNFLFVFEGITKKKKKRAMDFTFCARVFVFVGCHKKVFEVIAYVQRKSA